MNSIYVPLADPKAQYLNLKEEINEAISRVLYKGNYVAGEEVEAFEEEWARYCKAKYCVGVSSCTDALYLTLKVIAPEGGCIIWTTPFTFYATAQAIVHSGNHPYFEDVGLDGNLPPCDYGVSVAVPVHMYGRPGRWTGKFVIEDAAQAHGLPLQGLAACHSFYPTKNLGAMGQAGAMVTNDKELAAGVRQARTYGEYDRFVCHFLTGNHRMDELQAAILRAKLPHLEGWNHKRRAIASRYRQALEYLDMIVLPEDDPLHNYHIFAIRVKKGKRDDLAGYLAKNNIRTSVRYPIPIHLQPGMRHLGHQRGEYPNAETWCKETLSLPMFPEMTTKQVEYVCEKVKEWGGMQ